MKFKIYLITILLMLSGCMEQKSNPALNPNLPSPVNYKDCCQNKIVLPEGKGRIFRLREAEAIQIAKKNYNDSNSLLKEKSDAVTCQSTLFWYVVLPEAGTKYVIERTSGKIISKTLLPTLKVDTNGCQIKTNCGNAISIGENSFKKSVAVLGYSDQEAINETNQYDHIVCDLPKFWMIVFEYKYYNISDLNSEEDIVKLPNTHGPIYFIDKCTGKILD